MEARELACLRAPDTRNNSCWLCVVSYYQAVGTFWGYVYLLTTAGENHDCLFPEVWEAVSNRKMASLQELYTVARRLTIEMRGGLVRGVMCASLIGRA